MSARPGGAGAAARGRRRARRGRRGRRGGRGGRGGRRTGRGRRGREAAAGGGLLPELGHQPFGVRQPVGGDVGAHLLLLVGGQVAQRDVLRAVQGRGADRPHVLGQAAEDRDVAALRTDVVLRPRPPVRAVRRSAGQQQDEHHQDEPPEPVRSVVEVLVVVLVRLARCGPQGRRLGRGAVLPLVLDGALGGSSDGDRDRGRWLRLDLDDVGDDRRDVVGATALEREVDQAFDGHVGAGLGRQRVADRVLAHHVRQAVAAQQVAVAGAGLAHGQVEADVLATVEGVGDDVLLRVLVRLLGGDASFVEQGLHEGVVLGDLLQRAVAQQVAPRVPHVDQSEATASTEQRGHRRAHARELGVAAHHVTQVVVRGVHGAGQRLEQVAAG